jgi:glutamate--cysteine ligase
VCASFVAGRDHGLERLADGTLHLPYATSLRMGRLGYQSDAQASLAVSYNGLEGYAASLQGALTQPYPAYEQIGVRNLGGEYNQLSTSLLQIENEFYGTIRPKRVIQSGERPLHALRQRGVEYIEVRCMDLDPFVPVGITAETVRFLDIFLLHCLLQDSPPDSPQEIAALGRNQHLTAAYGREPGLALERAGRRVRLADWAAELLAQCAPVAEALDAAHGGTAYAEALKRAHENHAAPERLSSARALATMRRDFDGSHTAFMRAQSEQTRNHLLALPWAAEHQATFAAMANVSVRRQAAIEAADQGDFEAFRTTYVAPERLRPTAPAATA